VTPLESALRFTNKGLPLSAVPEVGPTGAQGGQPAPAGRRRDRGGRRRGVGRGEGHDGRCGAGDGGRADRRELEGQAAAARRAGRGADPGTVRNVAAVLRRAFAAGVKLGLVKTNPVAGVRLPASPHREQLFLTAAQVHDLADGVGPHWRPLVLTAAFTGLRAGELAGLRRRDVDLLRGTIRVERAVQEVGGTLHVGPPKTPRSRRTVALPAFLTSS
jgi:integrase